MRNLRGAGMRDGQKVADFFAEDGVFRGMTEDVPVVTGRDAIAKRFIPFLKMSKEARFEVLRAVCMGNIVLNERDPHSPSTGTRRRSITWRVSSGSRTGRFRSGTTIGCRSGPPRPHPPPSCARGGPGEMRTGPPLARDLSRAPRSFPVGARPTAAPRHQLARPAALSGPMPGLGLGAQKGGTTWLHNCLARHPDCFLPEEKEVHDFDWQVDTHPLGH